MEMRRQANGAYKYSGQAVDVSLAEADHCPADCWLHHEGNIKRSLTGWPLKTWCGICGLEVERQEWNILRRRLSESEPA